jgi:ATP-binding protein involved in chromosome partitioning
MPGVRRVVAVASGKGGVGKSTCSVNLACALARTGLRVGLLDCDIYGPSIPLMMGIQERPTLTDDERLVPPVRHGVKLMSMGFLIDPEQAVIWRGPMIQKTIHQFINQVAWGDLDYLLVDLPPGTGDAQLSIAQSMALSGAIIVTTPQTAAVSVALRGAAMFQQVKVPLLGVIENMSYFADDQGRRQHLFGQGGGQKVAAQLETEFLGEVPLDPLVRLGGDHGIPAVISHPDSLPAKAFHALALRLLQLIGQ